MSGALYKYQKDAVIWMQKREDSPDRFGIRGGMLCDDMGLGKTRTCLSLIRLHPVQTLIVCPLSLVHQWQREAQTVLSCQINAAVTPTDIDMFARVIIISHTCLISLHDGHAIFVRKLGRLILDEAHKAKSSTSALNMKMRCIHASRRWLVTGTPIVTTKIPARQARSLTHKSTDLRSYLKILSGQITLRVCREIEQSPELRASMMMRRNKDIFDLPPVHVEIQEETFLSNEEQRTYDGLYQAGEQIVDSIQSKNSDEESVGSSLMEYLEEISADATDTLEDILRSESSSANDKPEDGDGGSHARALLSVLTSLRKYCATAPSKMEAFEHDVKQLAYGSSRSLVFCSFRDEIDAVSRRAQEHLDIVMEFHGGTPVEERTSMISLFTSKDPRSMCLVIQIECGGCGLNLQTATHVFLMSPSWSASTEDQAIARAHRITTQHHVFVKKYIMANTLESFIHTRANQKRMTASVMLNERPQHQHNTWDVDMKLFE